MSKLYNEIVNTITQSANPKKAAILQRFFKTGKGQYGEGDRFLGIVVPIQRKIAKQYATLPIPDALKLLHHKMHECRLIALFILTAQFKKGDEQTKKNIFNLYLKNTVYINNWDLVDLSAKDIVGGYLYDKDRSILEKLARSQMLWERRIAVLATFYFIARGEFDDALHIATILLHDKHDLIHKAVGWMLREVGKRNQSVEETFLKEHHKTMPRTMLRYAIEKFDNKKRQRYMRW